MKLLLDTHAFLWLAWGHANLSPTAQSLLGDPQHDLYLSVASVWEMAIKIGKKKLTLTASLDVFLSTAIAGYRLTELPIQRLHAEAVLLLPEPHSDPFDRILIAQGVVEQMGIVSADSIFDSYPVTRLW